MNRKKDKFQKNLLTAGLGLATVVAVGVATDTQAKANDTDTTNTTTTVRTDTTSKELKEKVEAQEKVVVNKKAEVEELKNNVGSATKEVENLEEKAKEATPEKISKVEKVIEDKTVDLKINEEKAKSLASAESNKQKEVALSTTDVKVAEINLNKAKEETEKAKTDLQSAKEVLAGTNAEKVAKALEEAKAENTNAKADVEAKKTALEKAKTDDTTRQNEINKLTTQKQQAETTLTNAQTDLATKISNYNTVNSELDTAKAKLIKAQNDVDGINRIHLTPEYVKALKKYMNIVDKEDGTLGFGDYTDEDMKSAENELKKMKEIKARKRYSTMAVIAALTLSGPFFAIMFGGTFKDSLFAFLIMAIQAVFLTLTAKYKLTSFVSNFLGSFIATVLVMLLNKIFLIHNPFSIIIMSLMPLVPGVQVTNAVRDFMAGDYLSGMIGIQAAIFVSTAIALGVVMGLKLV